MKLRKLTLKNIRSYENQEIEFPEGSLLLAGDIGSGKTSILLAIEYALFGLQPGQRGLALLRNGAEEGYVSLLLNAGGKEVSIERKLKRNSKGVSNEYAAITIDGEKTESSITEIKTKILSILGYPQEFIKRNNLLYRYTLYTPQEQMKQIILEESETRLNIIRHIFGVDKYKRIRENLSLITSFLKEESKSLQFEVREIVEIQNKFESSQSFLNLIGEKISQESEKLIEKKNLRKQIENELTQLDEKTQEKNTLERELDKTQILHSTKIESLSNSEKELIDLEKSLILEKEFDEKDLEKINKEIELISTNIENLNLKHIELNSRINSIQQKRDENTLKRERIFKIDICPTCLQDVSETHKHNILNETESLLSSTSRELKLLELQKSQLSEELILEKRSLLEKQQKRTEIEILKSNRIYIVRTKSKILQLKKNKQSLKKDIEILESHIQSIKENIFNFNPLNNQLTRKKEDLSNAFETEKSVEISIAELTREKELTQKEISQLKEEISEKLKKKESLSQILELNDWLSNQFLNLIDYTERNVLMKLRMQFSELFSKWFQALITTESLEVRLDESFTPIIIQGDAEMDYSFLSGGERTAVALAYRLALNQTINSLFAKIDTKDIVILDEPTDGFSEAQITKLRDVLAELNVSQLIIVSHEQKIEGFVDHIIKIRKESDTSDIDIMTSQIKNLQDLHGLQEP